MWLTIFNEDFFQFFFSARVGQVPDKKSSWFRHVFLFLIVPQLVNKISFLLTSLCRPSIIFKIVDFEHFNIATPCGFTQIMHMHWDPETSLIWSTCFQTGYAHKSELRGSFGHSCVLVKKTEQLLTHVVFVKAQGPLDLSLCAQVHIHITLSQEIRHQSNSTWVTSLNHLQTVNNRCSYLICAHRRFCQIGCQQVSKVP